jgi:hypothetical protein
MIAAVALRFKIIEWCFGAFFSKIENTFLSPKVYFVKSGDEFSVIEVNENDSIVIHKECTIKEVRYLHLFGEKMECISFTCKGNARTFIAFTEECRFTI